ncbi:unnamed protein product [Scytosiphon promiscuus]
MFRTALAAIAPRVTVSSKLSLAPLARRAPLARSLHVGRSPPLEGEGSASSTAAASRLVSARKCCSRQMSSSANPKMASAAEGSDSAAGVAGEGQVEEGSGPDTRDPVTGEGMWMDQEDEPLVLEKPKKIQKFCGKVVSKSGDKSIKVAVPYWFYVKGLGRRIIRHSKIMAHDEDNSANVGDTVILVDCKQKSKRKKHKLSTIVKRLPRLEDE